MTNPASEVAVTLHNQIRAGSVKGARNGTHAMMCWGFEKPMCDTDNSGQHSLVFRVSGLSFSGKVQVKLTHSDTYTISTYARGDVDWNERLNDVYCEELAQMLDNLIEGQN